MATWGHRGGTPMGHRGGIVAIGKSHCFAFGVAKLATSHFGMSYFHMFSYLMPYLLIYIYIYIINGFLSQAILDYVHGGGSWTEFLAIESLKKLQKPQCCRFTCKIPYSIRIWGFVQLFDEENDDEPVDLIIGTRVPPQKKIHIKGLSIINPCEWYLMVLIKSC